MNFGTVNLQTVYSLQVCNW